VNRFVDRDALMRHFGHGVGHLEYGRVHEIEPETGDEPEDREELEIEHDEEEGDELMDVDGNEEEEEPTVENSDSGDDSDDSENSDESAGYASF
jgi:hypothetical protein